VTPKQRRFVEEYAVDHNGTQAAIRAGYSPRRAHVTASELLRQPDVLFAMAGVDEKKRDRLGVTLEEIVAHLRWFIDAAKDQRIPSRDGLTATVELAKVVGLMVERSQVEQVGEVRYVHKLTLERTLEALEVGE